MTTVLLSICAWTLVLSSIWSIYKSLQKGITQLKHLHQIPCAGCIFFTGDYRLKCTVRPTDALTESAIGCIDYEPASSYFNPPVFPCHSCTKSVH